MHINLGVSVVWTALYRLRQLVVTHLSSVRTEFTRIEQHLHESDSQHDVLLRSSDSVEETCSNTSHERQALRETMFRSTPS